MKFLKSGTMKLNEEMISRFEDAGDQIKVWIASEDSHYLLSAEESRLFRLSNLHPDFVTQRAEIDNGCKQIELSIVRSVETAIENYRACYPDRVPLTCIWRGNTLHVSAPNQGADFCFKYEDPFTINVTSSTGKCDRFHCVARDKAKPPSLYLDEDGRPEVMPAVLVRKILEPMMFAN